MTNPLKAFRKRHLLSQAAAAEAVGLAESTWRQLETGWRGKRPSRQLLGHLACLDRLTAIAACDSWQRHALDFDWPKPPPEGDDFAEDDQGRARGAGQDTEAADGGT